MFIRSAIQSACRSPGADLEVSIEPIPSEILFLSLPSSLEPDQVPVVLARLAEEIKYVPFQASSTELKRFVQWALSQSYAAQLAPYQRMELLNLAWQVQKLLWSL